MVFDIFLFQFFNIQYMTWFFIIALTLVLIVLGWIPFKAGAAYRFRGKTLLFIEGVALWACAAYGLLTGSVWILLIGTIAGIGISQLPDAKKRLE